jgi:hypothetical protein
MITDYRLDSLGNYLGILHSGFTECQKRYPISWMSRQNQRQPLQYHMQGEWTERSLWVQFSVLKRRRRDLIESLFLFR